MSGCDTRLEKKKQLNTIMLLRTEHGPDWMLRTPLFSIIVLTFCNLFLGRQHILQQNSMISKACLGDCSEFKMKQQGAICV